MLQRTLGQALGLCSALIEKDNPFFLHGPPGVGKSDFGQQLADKFFKGNLIDLRLSLYESIDIRGLPMLMPDEELVKWLPPEFLPNEKRDGKVGLLLLDELNAAPMPTQVAAFQLVLNRRIGSYEFPKGWRIMAAGNLVSDKAAAKKLPSALANRFAHIHIIVDVESWALWALAHGISPIMIAFHRYKKTLLHNMTAQNQGEAFGTPRSWVRADQFVTLADASLRLECIAANVGEAEATEFMAFMAVQSDLPKKAEIVNKPKTAPVPESKSAQWLVATAMGEWAEKDNLAALYTYAQRLGPELTVVTMTDAVRRNHNLVTTKPYLEFQKEFKDVILPDSGH